MGREGKERREEGRGGRERTGGRGRERRGGEGSQYVLQAMCMSPDLKGDFVAGYSNFDSTLTHYYVA